MYCKWCGMESEDEEKCSWCGRVLTATPQASDEKVSQEISSISEEPSSEIGGIVLSSEGTGNLADVVGPLPTDEPAFELETIAPFQYRLEQYLSVMLILLALGMLITHFYPDSWLRQLFLLLFVSGFLMCFLRIIPDYEDTAMRVDVLVAVGTFVIIGPVYAALAIRLTKTLGRSAYIPIVRLVISYLIIRFAVGSATHGLVDTLRYFALPNISLSILSHILEILPPAVIFGGWVAATYSRSFISELKFE